MYAVPELIRRKGVETRMIYTHVLSRGRAEFTVRSMRFALGAGSDVHRSISRERTSIETGQFWPSQPLRSRAFYTVLQEEELGPWGGALQSL